MTPQALLVSTIKDTLGDDVPVDAVRGEQTDDPQGRPKAWVIWVALGSADLLN